MSAFGLLPSPPISDSRPASTGPESYFACKEVSNADGENGPYELEAPTPEKSTEKPTEKPMEMPQEEIKEKTPEEVGKQLEDVQNPPHTVYRSWQTSPVDPRLADVTSVQEAHSNFIRQCENDEMASPSDGPRAPPVPFTSPASDLNAESVSDRSPRPQRPRTGTVSSEASWVPNNFSYCKTWLQGVPLESPNGIQNENPRVSNRRKFQIIEKDPPMPSLDAIPGAKALDEPVVGF
jgi:hypothetical protein